MIILLVVIFGDGLVDRNRGRTLPKVGVGIGIIGFIFQLTLPEGPSNYIATGARGKRTMLPY